MPYKQVKKKISRSRAKIIEVIDVIIKNNASMV